MRQARKAEKDLYTYYGLPMIEHTVPIASLDIRVRVCETGKGDPVLIVPGNTGDSFPFVPLMPYLKGKRILALNRPGGGLSDGFDHHTVDFRVLARHTLNSVLDYFHLDRVAIVAHSMGGHWSLWYTIDEPHRVKRLALLGVPGNVMGCHAPFLLRLTSVSPLNRLLFPAIIPKSPDHAFRGLSVIGHPPKTISALPAEMQGCYYSFAHLPNYKLSSLSLMEVTNTLFGGKRHIQIDATDLNGIRQPVLLVWGQNDPFGSVDKGRELAGALPVAKLQLVENGGHLPWLDAAEPCGGWVSQFLAGK